MATMSGILSPPPNSDSTTSSVNLLAKRKRDDSVDTQNTPNGTSVSESAASTDFSPEESKALVQLLIDVLTRYDTTPSILARSIPDIPLSAPQIKRQKAENGAEQRTSILARLSSDAYTSIDQVLDDIDIAASDVMDKLALPTGATQNQYIPVSSDQSEISMKVTAFKQRAHELVKREKAGAEARSKSINGQMQTSVTSGKNGLGSNHLTEINAHSRDNKVVLTLYGNAPGPKQLFSSLQIPIKAPGDNKDVLQTIREAGLPNGITTTQVIPIQSTGLADDRKRVPTLGELFPTPPNVPALVPPKPSKIATTRSSPVGWYQPSSAESIPRTASYFRQSISSGQWLDYSTTNTALQNTKRKHRDRALSLVGSRTPALEVESEESEATKLDALFRSAYSSFAPTRDDSAAIIPTGQMDRIWWQQVGERSFERMIEHASRLDLAIDPDLETENKVESDDEIALLEHDIDELERDIIDPSLVSLDAGVEKSVEEKDAEEILQGISELLETLNSYQRNRHMSLNPASRSAGLLPTPDTTPLIIPTKPSESEQATYEILKSQLTLMIATLPPFAVAKLDPDRLSKLSISTKIEVQTNNYKGVMEEDESSARAKIAAMGGVPSGARPVSTSTLHRSSSSSALYGNQYSAQRPAVQAPQQQYYGSTQTPVRPPSTNMQRPPSTGPVPYQSQRTQAATPYRSTAYTTPAYPHQSVRPVQQAYTPSGHQPQYSQSPSQSYLRAPSHNYQQQPQPVPTAMNGRYQSTQSSYAHQGQPPHNGMGYQYGNGGQVQRQASPQKPIYSHQPVSGARPVYSTPNPSISQESRTYVNSLAQAVNGTGPRAPQSQYTSQPTGYSTFLNAQQQQNIMDEQRARLAANQQNAQQQARSVAQAALASPSRTPSNPTHPVATGL